MCSYTIQPHFVLHSTVIRLPCACNDIFHEFIYNIVGYSLVLVDASVTRIFRNVFSFVFQLCTMDDHHQEVIAYCRENGFHGLMADDGEYAVFDPPRYFSSEHLKLTYKV